jgi:hypothetical protein
MEIIVNITATIVINIGVPSANQYGILDNVFPNLILRMANRATQIIIRCVGGFPFVVEITFKISSANNIITVKFENKMFLIGPIASESNASNTLDTSKLLLIVISSAKTVYPDRSMRTPRQINMICSNAVLNSK